MKTAYRKNIGLVFVFIAFVSCTVSNKQISDITPNPVVPSTKLIAYQQMELIGFIHFTINTFTGKEWGYGDESPQLFNPTDIDVEQWVKTAKAAGMKELILTAKHHDGFCLWPSKYTEHSIKNSPYKNGKGDLVKEFVDACKKYGIKAGLYLSPWDRNNKDYGKPAYITYYHNQLKELLTQYGQINEIWFDGANGGDGYYGGAKETRKIESKSYYGWPTIFSLVRSLQPNIKIFSDAGPDVHWIGNEHGFAGATFWSTIKRDQIVIGNSNASYLNSGDSNGKDWVVGQCDVSIRPGWFYHQNQDNQVKTPQELVDIYYKSIGRNAVMLLNLPPDKRGKIFEKDVQVLQQFKQIIDHTFAVDLTKGATVSAENVRLKNIKFAAINVLDSNMDSYWACDDGVASSSLIVQLSEEKKFDRIMLQEPIQFGQRIVGFAIDIMQDNTWKTVFKGTTIGYKRLLRFDPVITDKVRLRILKTKNTIAISKLGLFLSDPNEKAL